MTILDVNTNSIAAQVMEMTSLFSLFPTNNPHVFAAGCLDATFCLERQPFRGSEMDVSSTRLPLSNFFTAF
jgi:hypothetical protein